MQNLKCGQHNSKIEKKIAEMDFKSAKCDHFFIIEMFTKCNVQSFLVANMWNTFVITLSYLNYCLALK